MTFSMEFIYKESFLYKFVCILHFFNICTIVYNFYCFLDVKKCSLGEHKSKKHLKKKMLCGSVAIYRGGLNI